MTTFEVARALAQARSYGLCEGCGLPGRLDPHHRMTRGSGGVHGAGDAIGNDIRNLLMLCRPCHDSTLADAEGCIEIGWVIERRAGVDPRDVPALIRTVNGYGWWFLTEDGGYRWADELNIQPGYVLTYAADTSPHCFHWEEGDGKCCDCGEPSWCPDGGETPGALARFEQRRFTCKKG